MAACIQPDCLFFFRINSSDRWTPALKLERDPHHAFLDHDSFLECSLPFELTEYEVEQSLKSRGVLGTLHQSLAPAIYDLVKSNPVISADDKAAIGLALVGARRITSNCLLTRFAVMRKAGNRGDPAGKCAAGGTGY